MMMDGVGARAVGVRGRRRPAPAPVVDVNAELAHSDEALAQLLQREGATRPALGLGVERASERAKEVGSG
jgi:hypothetical protein